MSDRDEEQRAGPDRIADLIRFAGPIPAPSPDFKARLRARLHEVWIARVRARRRRQQWAAGAAAAAAVVVAIGVFAVVGMPESVGTVVRIAGEFNVEHGGDRIRAGNGDTILAGSRISTSAGPAAVRLASGTDLRLDDDTVLVLLGAENLDLVRGRIYVDSESVPTSLAVDTEFGRVRDVGTQFSVAVDSTSLTVAVRRGLVEVDRALDTVDRISVVPGFAVTVDADGNSQMDAVDPAGATWRWTEAIVPAMKLTDRSLSSFLALTARQTGLRVEYRSAAVELAAQRTMIGGELPEMPPRQALEVVVSATDFEVEVTDSRILVGRD